MLHVQKLLKDAFKSSGKGSYADAFNAIQHLKDYYGIKSSMDMTELHLVSLNYDQIASPKTHPIVRECRGLILYLPSFEIASRSFTRFYNYGELSEETTQVDFSKSELSEKMDGSLINFYYDDVKQTWRVATRGTTTASNAFTKDGIPYLKLVCDALGIDNAPEYIKAEGDYYLPCNVHDEYTTLINNKVSDYMYKECTYIFELVSPHIHIVTKYENTELYLLGVRVVKTGDELDADTALLSMPEVKRPKKYPVSSKEEAMTLLNNLNVNNDRLIEGFVVHDKDKGIRTKLKNNVYLQAHRMANGELDEKHLLQLVIENDEEEFLLYYPELREQFMPYINARTNALEEVDSTYRKAKEEKDNGASMKDIASWVKPTKVGDVVLPMLGRNIDSAVLMFSNMNEKSKVSLIKKFL